MLEPTIRKVREGSLMYVDLFRTYYGQASYGFKHKHPDQGKLFANGNVSIMGIDYSGFSLISD